MDRRAIVIVRVAVAALLEIHGVARLVAGGVTPFGDWLTSLGMPLGHAVAWGITAFEILAPPLLALGFFVRWIAPVHIAILGTGIALVHAPSGWFVVGLGRNGVEYSVLLIACLVAVMLTAPTRGSHRRTSPAPPSSRVS